MQHIGQKHAKYLILNVILKTGKLFVLYTGEKDNIRSAETALKGGFVAFLRSAKMERIFCKHPALAFSGVRKSDEAVFSSLHFKNAERGKTKIHFSHMVASMVNAFAASNGGSSPSGPL